MTKYAYGAAALVLAAFTVYALAYTGLLPNVWAAIDHAAVWAWHLFTH